MFSPPLIHYVIVDLLARQSKLTQFQEFSHSWLSLYQTIAAVLQGPTCYPDIIENSFERRVGLRASGIVRFSLAVITPTVLHRTAPIPFMMLVTTQETDEDGRNYCSSTTDPVLHLATNLRPRTRILPDPNAEVIGQPTLVASNARRAGLKACAT